MFRAEYICSEHFRKVEKAAKAKALGDARRLKNQAKVDVL